MKKTALFLLLILAFPAVAFGAEGQPFKALQEQINQLNTLIINLQTQVNNIQLTPGPQGPAGPAAISGYEMVSNSDNPPSYPCDGMPHATTVYCPAGKSVLGGGYIPSPTHPQSHTQVLTMFPVVSESDGSMGMEVESLASEIPESPECEYTVRLYVFCADMN